MTYPQLLILYISAKYFSFSLCKLCFHISPLDTLWTTAHCCYLLITFLVLRGSFLESLLYIDPVLPIWPVFSACRLPNLTLSCIKTHFVGTFVIAQTSHVGKPQEITKLSNLINREQNICCKKIQNLLYRYKVFEISK